MGMEQFANHIIAVAQRHNREITNLKLQKIMYFALKNAKEKELLSDEKLKELYDEPFLVWAYGPVVKSQYDRFKKFGSSPILGVFEIDNTLDILNETILENLAKSVSRLVTESHEIPFWKQNKDRIYGFRSDVSYELGDI